MAVIYYADDEREIRDVVASFLQNEGHEVTSFENGDLLFEAFLKKECDLVILDIMMPGTDGIGILQKLRGISKVPVILLTAKDTDADYYNGLALGSDDYLTKPFKPILLSAKINALFRRIRFENEDKPSDKKADITCGNVCYSYVKHELAVNDKPLSLTPTELKFLIFMMEHFEEAVSKELVLDTIWDINSEIESRVADETNRRLRRKMTAAGADVYVQTVWGYGFKLTKCGEQI